MDAQLANNAWIVENFCKRTRSFQTTQPSIRGKDRKYQTLCLKTIICEYESWTFAEALSLSLSNNICTNCTLSFYVVLVEFEYIKWRIIVFFKIIFMIETNPQNVRSLSCRFVDKTGGYLDCAKHTASNCFRKNRYFDSSVHSYTAVSTALDWWPMLSRPGSVCCIETESQ